MTASHMDQETLAMFAEGKLTAEEARPVAEHLADCARCLKGVRAVVETLREEEAAEQKRSRSWLPLAAIVVLTLLGAAAIVVWLGGRSRDPVSRLVALSPTTARPVEPRLTGGFAWAAYRGPVRADDVQASAQQMKLVGAAGELIEQAERDDSPATQHAAAVAMILTGDPLQAVSRLRALADASPSNADLRSDLAAAQSAAALRLGRPSLLPEALASADRALQLKPDHAEALFNRAVILERLGLTAEARAAWQRYLAIEPASPWATEARERLARLNRVGESNFRRELPRLEQGDPQQVAELVRRFPQQSRTFAEGEYLARWAEAFARGDDGESTRWLTLARRIGTALHELSGESLLRDAVAAVDRADAATRATLAQAHLAYRRGRIAYSRQRLAEGETELRAAARALDAGGTPMALVARYYAANTRFDQNDVRGARAELQSLLATPAARPEYIALRSHIAWELALCDAVEADWNAAHASLTAAADGFRRLGERGNGAFIDTLLAQALGGLGRPDEAWDARIRSFAALAQEEGDRLAVSVNSAAASELRAGRRDAALALLRVFASTARTSQNDALLASALLPQTLLAAGSGDASATRATLAEMSAAAERIVDPQLREKARNDVRFARASAVLATQPAEAARLLTEAIAFYERSSKPALLPEPYLLRARSRMRLGDTDGAAADLESGIAIVEAQRVELARGVVGTGVLDAGAALYEDALRLALARNDAAAAFAYAERSREELHPDLAALQRRLAGTGTAVLHLTSMPDELVALAITSDRVDTIRAPIRRGESAQLYDLVFEPAERKIGAVDYLIVVPDRWLVHVPFAALYDDDAKRFLVERHSVSIATSASSLQAGQTRAAQSAVAMLLPSGEQTGLAALPEIAGELADVCGVYPTCATRQPSTFAALHAAAQDADVLHLAGHTQSSTGETALVFGAERASWRTIAATPFARGGVVVLAACETLRTSEAPHQRSLSLGAAFAAAGAHDVIGTLTPIADADARELFGSIHRELASGASPADAVRRTQMRALAAVRANEHPAWQSLALLTRRIPPSSTHRRIPWTRASSR